MESSYHGSALLYRLLDGYPREKLAIIEGDLFPFQQERRIPNVRYKTLRVGNERLLRTRLHKFYSAILSLSAAGRAKRIELLVGDFSPEAVLTVTHGYSWITAAMFAAKNHLPLHLICHDDWPSMAHLVSPIKRWLNERFAEIYRQAASRLCVSPNMVEEYEGRYGVPGTVLYPSRAADAPNFHEPPERLANNNQPLVFAFGGTINTLGHVAALRKLSEALEPIRARLDLYGPISEMAARRAGLLRSNVRVRGLVPASEFVTRLREEADVLFVPLSFAPSDHVNMKLCFPSKLADYTAAGLPILIYGPKYSAAVRWAEENPGIAEVVSAEDPVQLEKGVSNLTSPEHRFSLASCALHTGRQLFSHKAAESIFSSSVQRAATLN